MVYRIWLKDEAKDAARLDATIDNRPHVGYDVDYYPHQQPQQRILLRRPGDMMKTIQMTIDDDLLAQVDDAIARLGATRSAFIRESLRQALTRHEIERLERQHRDGYQRQPVAPGEFDIWESEQVWESV